MSKRDSASGYFPFITSHRLALPTAGSFKGMVTAWHEMERRGEERDGEGGMGGWKVVVRIWFGVGGGGGWRIGEARPGSLGVSLRFAARCILSPPPAMLPGSAPPRRRSHSEPLGARRPR